jgi:hypothetical protein
VARKIRKTTPEERERLLINQEHFRRVLMKALERDGATPEEIAKRVGPPRIELPYPPR